MIWRIKAEIYVQALVRRVYTAHGAAYIMRRGDADAGGIFIRVNRLDGCSGVLTMFTRLDGEKGWRVLVPPTTPDAQAAALLDREIERDRDIWVVEIEDRQAHHFLEEPVDGVWTENE